MLYSVYDYTSHAYTYYEATGDAPPTGWFRPPKGVKLVPERIAAKLPSGAVSIGSGSTAKGIIATQDPEVGSLQKADMSEGSTSWWKVVALAVASFWAGSKWAK